jgi:hypothetical protein
VTTSLQLVGAAIFPNEIKILEAMSVVMSVDTESRFQAVDKVRISVLARFVLNSYKIFPVVGSYW